MDLGSLIGFINIGAVAKALLWTLIGFILLAGLFALGFLIMNEKKYIYKLTIWKKVGSNYVPILKTKAKPIKLDKSGTFVWYVRKAKRYIPPLKYQTKKNHYNVAVLDDGVWRDFYIGNVDEKLQEAGVEMIRDDLRLPMKAIEKIMEKKFGVQTFLEKYGLLIGYTAFILFVLISFLIVMTMQGKIIEKESTIIDKANTLITNANEVLAKTNYRPDSERESETGLIPVDKGG